MTLFGMRVKVHILSPIVFVLLMVFSGPGSLFPPLIALSIHESAHLISAVLLKARIDEIELMPFGAAVRLYELWEISPYKLMIIALSGPFSNLLTASLLSLVMFFFPYLAPYTASFLYAQIALSIVNLLPALPLDGGRFLCALLALRIKRASAVRIGILLGRILGVVLIIASVCFFIKHRSLPLIPLLAAVYLFASSEQEKRQSEGAHLRRLILTSDPPSPVQRSGVILANQSATVYEAVRAVRPGEDSLFAITDDEGEILTLLPLKRVIKHLSENAQDSMSVFTVKPSTKISH